MGIILKRGIGAILTLLMTGFNSCNQTISTSKSGNFIDSLMNQMTIEEKVGQMTQICFSKITLGKNKELSLDTSMFVDAIRKYHVGSFLSGTGSANDWVEFNTLMQQIAVKKTRLGIPLLIGIDHIHGANYIDEGTILPHNILLGCSFDTALVKKAAQITTKETAVLGINWNFAPVLGLARNPYWPRFYETFGEDPFLVSELGAAFINGSQNCNSTLPFELAACAKHFVGYSDPRSGWDRTPAEIPQQKLFEFFIPPFKKAIDSGVKTIMANSGEVNGEPVHTSDWLLNDILRKELGFDGVLLTDIKDIQKVVEMHAGAKNLKEATLLAINAGFDVNMACEGFEFNRIMLELIEEGKITEARINESVRRILHLKHELGLFDNPYPSEKNIQGIGSQEYLDIARQIAEGSIVLLKNDGILPLNERNKKILLAGFATDSKKNLNGAWTHEWMGAEDKRHSKNMNTLAEVAWDFFGKNNVTCMGVYDSSLIYTRRFEQSANESDCIVLTVGEEPYSEFRGNITDLELRECDKKLLYLAIESAKPIVVILIEGRPRLITEFSEKTDALLFAGYPGIRGAEAIMNIITGKKCPSGKLCFSYPKYSGYDVNYYHKTSEQYDVLFPFGHGLSYNDFEYKNFRVNKTIVSTFEESITASVSIKNNGQFNGKETALWFISDCYGRITRPVKLLKHVDIIFLKPGEEKTIEFTFSPEFVLSYPDKNNQSVLEKGDFEISVGHFRQKISFSN